MQTTSYQDLIVTRDGVIDRVVLNRPQRLNALTDRMVDEINDYFGRLLFDETVRVVVMRGAGRAFCAGLDIRDYDPDEKASIAQSLLFQRKLADMILRMRRCPQPIIALLDGAASGGGFALALAADVRLATPETKMNAAFIRIGLSACDVGVSYFLPRIVGTSIAAELMLTGRFIDAERALRVGLVSEIVPADELEGAGDRMAQDMLRASPLGLKLTKEALAAAIDAASLDAVLSLENRNQMLCVASGDLAEGMRAFLEKRAPKYPSS